MPTSPHPRFRCRAARIFLALALCSAAFGVGPLTFSHTAAASGWAVIASPNVKDSSSNELQDVTCVSASDCWVVGSFQTSSSPLRTLIEHWDGASWSIVPSPNVVATGNNQHNRLVDVACSSSTDCWAVGTYRDQETDRTLILRWNGTSWSITPSPNASSKGNGLASVTCSSANDCWAVGGYDPDVAALNGASATLIQRWNGSAWSIVPSPNEAGSNAAAPAANGLSDVTCTSASDCWAVGGSKEFLQPSRTLIARWNGAEWSLVPSPNSGARDYNGLAAVSCASASNCWAVGSYEPEDEPERPRTFIARWNGSVWAAVPPGEQGRSGSLLAVTCPAATECWAVGTHIERWDGNSWSVSPAPNGGVGVACSSTEECWAVSQRRDPFETLILRYTRAAAGAPAQLLNISTRAQVQSGNNVLIGGFIITGSDPKNVLLRAIGPSLSGTGVQGALQNPTLELFQGNTLLASNDDWKQNQRAEIEATGIPPTNDAESAIVRRLGPGTYTAVVRGVNSAAGVALVEAYDLEQGVNAQLANLSTRAFVQTDDNVLIGGVIVGPANTSSRVLVRAIGPSLAGSGISNVLGDPTLELVDSNGVAIAVNNNWKETQQSEIAATGVPPSDDRESAILQLLRAGNYTAIVRGKDSTSGVALVEAFNLR